MVHDLICSLSREENFVSTLDDVGQSRCLQSKVLRLSLQVQGSRVEQTSPIATVGLSHVRSFTSFRAAVNLIPSLQRFHILRVLDLEGCHLWYHCDFNLEHILKLFHLRYLGLRNTCIGGLPRGLEKLRFLQTLDLKGANIKNLPSAVARLGQLMSLYVDFQTNLPERVVGHLTSTQVLSGVSIRQNPGFVRGLRNLTGLKELHIGWVISSDSKALEEELVEALHNLNKIQTLRIYCDFQDSLDVMEEHWVAPPHLRRFELHGTGYSSTMPAWIKRDPLVLTELSVLFISFGRLLQAEDMQIFGRLPALTTLTIRAPCKRWIVGPGFRCLRAFHFWNKIYSGVVMFQREAMPRVETISFESNVRKTINDASLGDYPGLGLGNLLSLERADILLKCHKSKVQEVEQLEAVVRQTICGHPNQVNLSLTREPLQKNAPEAYGWSTPLPRKIDLSVLSEIHDIVSRISEV